MSEQTNNADGPWEWRRVADAGCVVEYTLHGPDVLCRYWYDKPPSAHARLIAAARDLLEAAQLLEAAEDNRDDDCEECGGEGEPEACGKCFPPFDDARVKRRLAIAKATGAST